MSKSGGFGQLFFKSILPTIYSLGACIVILGAMFKILHLPFAAEMLGVGLSTEAVIFFLSAFEPRPKDYDWERVYPELSDRSKKQVRRIAPQQAGGPGATQQLDKMLENAKIGPQLIESLGRGLRGLADSAGKLGNISNAAVATNEYANSVKRAAQTLGQINQSYASTVTALNEIAGASKDAREYHQQVQNVTKNLSALNSVYELELKDANTHLKSMNKFYTNVSQAMESIAQAGKNSEQFRDELGKLTSNLGNLNKVYGSMLSAMRQ